MFRGKLVRHDETSEMLGKFVPDKYHQKFPGGAQVCAKWEPTLAIYPDGSLRGTGARSTPDAARAARVRAYLPGEYSVSRKEVLGF